MNSFDELQKFYNGKKVLLTGHTGFKGSYLTVLLALMGAEVYGYALEAPTEPSLFETLYGPGSSKQSRTDLCLNLKPGYAAGSFEKELPDGSIVLKESMIGDIRDFEKIKSYVNRVKPDVIIHMAAQPIVRESYRIPRETFEANVMGTVNLLESLRLYAQELKTAWLDDAAQPGSLTQPNVTSQPNSVSQPNATSRPDSTDQPNPASQRNPASQPNPASQRNPASQPNPAGQPNSASQPNPAAQPDSSTQPRVSFLNVTTDKVYQNEEKPGYAYREEDKLDGYDPYSNSKSCSELVTHSYRSAFFGDAAANRISSAGGCGQTGSEPIVRISTARAGNVIGGGDFAKDRIIPDCMRAQMAGQTVAVRNPYSTRPFQHVLEPLFVYLTIAAEQYGDWEKQGYYNVGPDLCDCVTTGELCDLYAKFAEEFTWENQAQANAPHEANFLRLDNTKIKETFGWKPHWHIEEAVKASVDWCSAYRESPEAANRELLRQVRNYVN